jgi:cellobiose phosphorylase
MKRFETRYGRFSEDGREYVIARPDTPRPWVNVICPGGGYGAVVSQAGGGYSWSEHATFNRLTRWEQDLVRDAWGRWLYCRDRDTHDLWSLAWQPVQADSERYECRHGIGYTTFSALHGGIESEYTIFVPPGEPLELWRVRLTNRSRRARRLDLTTCLEWNLGPAPDTHREFHRLFIDVEPVPAAHALLATKCLNTIAEGGKGQPWNVEWPHVAFHASSVRPTAFDGDKEVFLGRHGDYARPVALSRPRLSGTSGRGLDAIGALQVTVTLAPGETKEVTFALGLAPDRATALRLARRYRRPAAVEGAWQRMRRFWDDALAGLEVSTPDAAFDLLANTWLKYQALSSRIWGRTGYFQPGGAFGFRDQLQDSQVFLPLDPARTRDQLLLHAAHQFPDGTAYHWWHPLTEEGAVKKYNDDLLWLPFVTMAYLRETADYAVLDRVVPYARPPGSKSGARGRGPLYEHCRRAIDSFRGRLSPRGVPLMGAGDWNDGLSAIGAKLKSESVWLAHFLVGILDDWAALEEHRPRGDRSVATRYRREADCMRAAVNRHFWDGGWYQRATKDSGEVIGSKRNRDGRIYLNAQTWAILSRVVTPQRLPKVLAALDRHLYREYGPLLLAPAYRTPDANIGYLTRYAPGARENGGLYTHAGLWAIQAECLLGNAERAWQLWRSFCPVLRGQEPDFYKVEPYVMPGNVDGPESPNFGRGGWTWYTGSASWTLRVATEWILGVRPTYEGLVVQPCLPPGWKGFAMTRTFRGATYRIRVRTGAGRTELRVDGVVRADGLVPALGDGKVHEVEVRVPATAKRRTPRPPAVRRAPVDGRARRA